MIYIHHHLGLGDHIVCNGLVHHLLKITDEKDPLFLAVKKHNYSSVKHLYEDTRVILDKVENDQEAEDKYKTADTVLRIGFENHRTTDWEKSFYDQLGVDYEKRYSGFSIKRNSENEENLLEKLSLPEKFAFCNFTGSTGEYKVDVNTELPIVKLRPITSSIFDWIVVLEKATEIHTMDSSIFHLIKQLSLDCKKVFYDVRNTSCTDTFDEGWKII
jgi:hypothetical protein